MTNGAENAESARRQPISVAIGLSLLFAIPLLLVVFTGYGADSRAAKDQDRYHLVAAERFATEWPRFDFSDYESATTPAYHVLVSTFIRFVTGDTPFVRLFASLFTFGLLATLAVTAGRRTTKLTALILCAPLVASQYVFQAGAFMLPDNAGWWGVLSLLLLAYGAPTHWRAMVAGGVILVALVATRQIHLWAAGLVWLGAWLDPGDDRTGMLLSQDTRRSVQRTITALAFSLPAFLVVWWFYRLWGDALTPPLFQVGGSSERAEGFGKIKTTGGNLAAPATVLSIAGAIGLLYLGFCWRRLLDAMRHRRFETRATIAAGGVVGLFLGSIPPTSFSMDDGRWSGVWNVVRRLPTVADRSPLIIGLSMLGGIVIATFFVSLSRRDRWVFLAAWGGFIVAMTANALAWQRYYEPFAIVMFAVAAARAQNGEPAPRWALAGPLLLTIASAAMTSLSLR